VVIGRSLALAVVLTSCRPELDDRVSLVESPRLLAVRATPAEAKPGENVALEALFVDASGTIAAAPIDWSFCVERRALAESTPIAASCLSGAAGLVPLGSGSTASGALPADGCRLFGPDRPEPKPGEPSGRATDPDASGGYYQPLRIAWPGAVSVAEVRIRCGLAGATQEQVVQFGASRVNENPKILAFDHAESGARVTLQVRYSEPESYLWFDPVTRTLVERRETMRISWYATAGVFENERTADGRNAWTAPGDARDVMVWVVVRDDRGGVAFGSYRLQVQ
jgi:hypothetical protein